MTAKYRIGKNIRRTQSNNCDNGPQARPKSKLPDLLALGFTHTDQGPYILEYSWEGNFPIFTLARGIVVDGEKAYAGLVARHNETEILFSDWTTADDIKTRLDCEIFEIMQFDTGDGPPLDWQPDEKSWTEFEDGMVADGMGEMVIPF